MNTEVNDVEQDDVPMLGGLFDASVGGDGGSDSPILVETEEVLVETEEAIQEAVPTPGELVAGAVEAAKFSTGTVTGAGKLTPPPAAGSVSAVVSTVKGAAPASASSTSSGGAPAAGATAPAVDAATENAEPAPTPEWRKPLTSEEMDILFSDKLMVPAAPQLQVLGLSSKRGAYRIVTHDEVSEGLRDSQIIALQSSGKLPTSPRSISSFATRIRTNTELVRLAQEDRETVSVIGVTDSAQYGGDTMSAVNVTNVDTTDFLRYAWSNFTGATFGAEVVELGPDGKPLIRLEGHDAPLVRPNGELYYPRKLSLADRSAGVLYDTQMIRQAYESRIPVLLYGPPGTGKTALCEAVLLGMYTVSGTADTETADFVGSYVQNPDGTFSWVDGPLVLAMEAGVPLFIDEVALIDSRMLALVYSVMDGRNEIVITANPKRGVVKAQPGFYVIGACNPDVPGAVMSDALLSRFSLQVEVTTDYDMLKTMNVSRDIISVAKNLARMQAAGAIQKAPQTRELLAFEKIKAALGQPVALANMVSAALPTDRDSYITALSAKFDGTIAALKS